MQIFGNKLENIIYHPRPGVYGIFFNENQQIAVVKVPKGYFLPGGGKYSSESDETCLKRECQEELGWKISIGEFIEKVLVYFNDLETSRYLEMECSFYYGLNFEKIYSPTEDAHELVWISFQDASKQLYPENQRYIIQQVKKKSKIV